VYQVRNATNSQQKDQDNRDSHLDTGRETRHHYRRKYGHNQAKPNYSSDEWVPLDRQQVSRLVKSVGDSLYVEGSDNKWNGDGKANGDWGSMSKCIPLVAEGLTHECIP
jgi:hypothetical protein